MAQIVGDDNIARQMAGDPIFAHGAYYHGKIFYEGDSIPWYEIAPVYIFSKPVFKNAKQAEKYYKKIYKIASNIKKVYPIALEIQHTIDGCIAHLDSLPNKKAKDVYMKQIEKTLMNQYKPRLKKLTLAQGKLLIKLIDRQCNQTSYQLIKTYMGGFKAGVWNAFSSIFGASLKKQYDPEVDDRLTEKCILLIESGQM